MFDGRGNLTMNGDHIDLSFADPAGWPGFGGSPYVKFLQFFVGDADAGPSFSLGAIDLPPSDGERDPAGGLDPMHFHGTDQFRMLLGGDWIVARQELAEGSFAFQESGRVYQEGLGKSGTGWIFLVYGDRRGEDATLTLEADRRAVAPEYEGMVAGDDQPYPHPAGPKGVPAVATSEGPASKGYFAGSFADAARWNENALAAAWGDQEAGPVVTLMKAGPDQVVVPASTCSTEVLVIVAGGACGIGDAEYRRGDIRIQAADQPLPAVKAGPDGVELAVLISDRRATPTLADPSDEAGRRWLDDLGTRLGRLATAGAR